MEALLAYSYIAGIMDGEGAFMITRSTTGKGRKTPSYTPRIKVCMTTRQPLDFILKHTKLGTITGEDPRHRRPKSKACFVWQIHSLVNVPKFIDLIEQFLVLKGPQARFLREYCERFDKQKKCMNGVPKNVRIFREESYNKMRELNGRHAPATTNPSDIREDEVIV